MKFLKRDINLGKREKMILGLVLLAFIEVIYFYFRGKPYNGINSLGAMPNYIMVGLAIFFVAYYTLIEKQNFRKKHVLIGAAYAFLIAAPFAFERDIPKVNIEDAQDLIARTEGGKIIKDRDYSNKIDTYEGQEVYLIALEKKDAVYRYAFDPYSEQYYPFSN